jgi:hypothetical protein
MLARLIVCGSGGASCWPSLSTPDAQVSALHHPPHDGVAGVLDPQQICFSRPRWSRRTCSLDAVRSTNALDLEEQSASRRPTHPEFALRVNRREDFVDVSSVHFGAFQGRDASVVEINCYPSFVIHALKYSMQRRKINHSSPQLDDVVEITV